MPDIVCPRCGEEEALRGAPRTGDDGSDLIAITCESCGLVWDRDPRPRCPTCDSDDVRPALQAVLDKSRGTQLSIQSMLVVHLCPVCDADRWQTYVKSNTAIPPPELPV